MKLFKCITFLFCLLFSVNAFCATYYVDCGAGSDGTGSYASPWKYINSISIANNDSVHFKEGVTCTIDNVNNSAPWVITNSGVTIGCYDGDGDFSCDGVLATGADMPTIDGDDTYPTGDGYGHLMDIRADSVTIQDIRVTGAYGHGIYFDGNSYSGNNGTVQRCRSDGHYRDGIVGNKATGMTVDGNYVIDTGRINYGTCATQYGAAIEFNYGCNSTQIKNNYVIANYGEGIGAFFNLNIGNPIIVEKNVVYNNRSAGIHSSDSVEIIRYNLVGIFDADGDGVEETWKFGTWPNCTSPSNSGGINCIAVTLTEAFANNYQIYGNIVFGYSNTPGIATPLGDAPAKQGDTMTTSVFNNTVIDCNPNFRFNTDNDSTATIVVKNNISAFYDLSPNHAEVNFNSGGSITFNYNFWSSLPADADAIGANDPTYANPQLITQTGFAWPAAWNTLNAADFQLQSTSGAKSGGLDLGTSLEYVLIPNTCDFTVFPIVCTAADADDYTWPFGAFLGGVPVLTGLYPTSPQAYISDPQDVEIGATSSTNSNCKAETVATAPCASSLFADLSTSFTGGEGGTAHTLTVSQAAGASTTYAVICQDVSSSLESTCYKITVDVAAEGGSTPQPAPGTIIGGGSLTIIGGGNILIH